MNKNNVELLASYIDALYPIIYINHYDFKVVDDMISEIIDGRTILEYDSGIGVVDFESKSLQQESDLVRFLQVIKDEGYRKSMLLMTI